MYTDRIINPSRLVLALSLSTFMSVPLACDGVEALEVEQEVKELAVQCGDASGVSSRSMNVELISEAEAQRRIAAAQGELAAHACWSPASSEEPGRSEASPTSLDFDLSAPRKPVAGGFCIEVCCGGKFLCFVEK